MRTLYLEDGSKELIINPQFDLRWIIYERLGKDAADLFDEVIEDAIYEAKAEDEARRMSSIIAFD